MASIIPLTWTTLLLLSLNCILGLVRPDLAGNYLSSGYTLFPGQSIKQDAYQFILQLDCSLVLDDGGIQIWKADYIPPEVRECYLSLESDGKLVVYASNNRPIWSTPSQGRNGWYQLLMQKDRNVVIYGPERWATGTHIVSQYAADGEKNSTGRAGAVSAAGLKIPPPFITDDNHLLSGFSVSAGESLTQGSYIFTMQYDCNLVLYDSGTPIWATNTGGLASGCYLTLESDGKLVVYAQDNKVLWATKPAGPAGHNYLLLVQEDRNVVVYGPSGWNTGTNYVPSTYAALVGAKKDSTAAAAAVISQVVAG